MFLRAVALAGLVSLAPALSKAEPVVFELDPTHATIAFWVDHIGYAKTLGMFTEMSGSFTYDSEAQTVSDVEIRVAAASVFSNDQRRDDHVRNADFLNAETFPEIIFTATSGEPTGDNTGIIRGELTLLGQTRPLELAVTLNKDEAYPFGHKKRTLGLSAETTIMRSEYGMSYALGGLVGDEVDVQIEVEAIAQD